MVYSCPDCKDTGYLDGNRKCHCFEQYSLLQYIIMIDVRRTLENLHQILPDLTLEELFKVLDNIVEVPQFNLGQTTIRRDASNWNPYDSGTFVSNASK